VPTASAMSKAASHAMAEAATAEMADTYDAAVETHAVVDDAPPGTHAMGEATHAAMAEAMIEGAVVRVPAIKYVGVAVIAVRFNLEKGFGFAELSDGSGDALFSMGQCSLNGASTPSSLGTPWKYWSVPDTKGHMSPRFLIAPAQRDLIRLIGVMVDLYCASYATPPAAVTLDIDDTVDVVHGHQQLSLFNDHYDERCFLPIPIRSPRVRFRSLSTASAWARKHRPSDE
jgi:hypothetical protein